VRRRAEWFGFTRSLTSLIVKHATSLCWTALLHPLTPVEARRWRAPVCGRLLLLDRAAADQGQAAQHVHGLTQLLVAC
jgi:hypothetical protein